MRRSSWYVLLFVVSLGWGIAGLIAFLLVSRVGWFGILIIGLAICLVATLAELQADSPAASGTLLRRQYEQTFEGAMEERFVRLAQRVERDKWLYVARTIGIATVLIGLNMFIVHLACNAEHRGTCALVHCALLACACQRGRSCVACRGNGAGSGTPDGSAASEDE